MRMVHIMHHREPQWRSGLMLLAALDVTSSQGITKSKSSESTFRRETMACASARQRQAERRRNLALQPLSHVPRTMAVDGMVRGRTEAKSQSSPRPIESLLKPIYSSHDTCHGAFRNVGEPLAPRGVAQSGQVQRNLVGCDTSCHFASSSPPRQQGPRHSQSPEPISASPTRRKHAQVRGIGPSVRGRGSISPWRGGELFSLGVSALNSGDQDI